MLVSRRLLVFHGGLTQTCDLQLTFWTGAMAGAAS